MTEVIAVLFDRMFWMIRNIFLQGGLFHLFQNGRTIIFLIKNFDKRILSLISIVHCISDPRAFIYPQTVKILNLLRNIKMLNFADLVLF